MAAPEDIPAMFQSQPFDEMQLSNFERDLHELENPDRVAYRNRNASVVARSQEPRLLIVAGPGTGKSHLFMDRIRSWLREQPGERIYVSTFVRKLAQDLHSEVQTSDLSPAEKALVNVSTLHSLARSLVERNRGTANLSLDPHIRMIGSAWKEAIWGDVLSLQSEPDDPSEFSTLERQFHELAAPPNRKWFELRSTYFRLSRFYNALGFADSILHASEALRESEDLNSDRLWIIDEFQDFNAAEEALIELCLVGAIGVLMAGDDDQALYQDLKSSHPSIIRSHYTDPDTRKGMLPYCGRCSYHIALGAKAFLVRHHTGESISKVFLPLVVDESASRIRVALCSDPTRAVEYVEQFIDDKRGEIEERRDGILTGESKDPFLLVLSYQRDLAVFLQEEPSARLDVAVEEWRLEEVGPGADYFRILTYVRHANVPADNFALRKVLAFEGVAEGLIHSILALALREEISLSQVSEPSIGEALEKAREVTRVLSEASESDVKARELANLVLVEDEVRLATDLEAFPVQGERSQIEEEEGEVETAGSVSPVEKMPMIRAKGLSADHVILLGFDDINMGQVTRELFFVAMTRARRSLHLLTVMGARGSQYPHEFMNDIPEEHCEYIKHLAGGSQVFEGGRVELLSYCEGRIRAIERGRERRRG